MNGFSLTLSLNCIQPEVNIHPHAVGETTYYDILF